MVPGRIPPSAVGIICSVCDVFEYSIIISRPVIIPENRIPRVLGIERAFGVSGTLSADRGPTRKFPRCLRPFSRERRWLPRDCKLTIMTIARQIHSRFDPVDAPREIGFFGKKKERREKALSAGQSNEHTRKLPQLYKVIRRLAAGSIAKCRSTVLR